MLIIRIFFLELFQPSTELAVVVIKYVIDILAPGTTRTTTRTTTIKAWTTTIAISIGAHVYLVHCGSGILKLRLFHGITSFL
jgi:hypothetical protein